jgi:hypothetical protein
MEHFQGVLLLPGGGSSIVSLLLTMVYVTHAVQNGRRKPFQSVPNHPESAPFHPKCVPRLGLEGFPLCVLQFSNPTLAVLLYYKRGVYMITSCVPVSRPRVTPSNPVMPVLLYYKCGIYMITSYVPVSRPPIGAKRSGGIVSRGDAGARRNTL